MNKFLVKIRLMTGISAGKERSFTADGDDTVKFYCGINKDDLVNRKISELKVGDEFTIPKFYERFETMEITPTVSVTA